MNKDLGKHLGQIEITDLLEESIANAAIRRKQAIENSLVDISEEEATNIEGGLSSPIRVIPPITVGIILVDPIYFTV